jgi:uncharacterized membrane protein
MKLVTKTLLVTISALSSMCAFSAKYSVVDIGTNGGDYSAAYGINNNGDVVGVMAGPRYKPETPCNGIDLFYPDCINASDYLDEDGDGMDDDGEYSATRYPYHGFIMNGADKSIKDVGSIGVSPGFGRDFSLLNNINDLNVAVGLSIHSNDVFNDYVIEEIETFTETSRTNYTLAYGLNHIYVFGGLVGNEVVQDTWKYSVSSQTWTQIDDTPMVIGNYAAVYNDFNEFYVVGGLRGETATDDVWVFNFQAETWEQRSAIPTNNLIGGNLIVMDSTLMYFGGTTDNLGTTTSNQFLKYDTVEDSWSVIEDSNLNAMEQLAFAKTFNLHGRVYFAMGKVNGTCSKKLWSILPIPADVVTGRELSFNVREHTELEAPVSVIETNNAFSYNNRGYIGGGKICGEESEVDNTRLLEFNPSQKYWNELSFDDGIGSDYAVSNTLSIYTNVASTNNVKISALPQNLLGIRYEQEIEVFERSYNNDSSNFISINNNNDMVGFGYEIDPEVATKIQKKAMYIPGNGDEIKYVSTLENIAGHESQFNGVNDNGIAVGWGEYVYRERFTRKNALIYDANTGESTFLNDVRNDAIDTVAMDVNNQNAIVGYTMRPIGGGAEDIEAFLKVGDDITMLGQLGAKFEYSKPHAINELGQIVGDAQKSLATQVINSTGLPSFAKGFSGFLYENGTMTDLNNYLSCEMQQKYDIISARDINDSGQIAVVMLHKGDGSGDKSQIQLRAARLDPVEGGIIETCETGSSKKSKSGSMGWLLMPFLLILAIRRRKIVI